MRSQSSGDAIRQVNVIADSLLRDFGAHLDIRDVNNPDPGEQRKALLARALAALVVKDRTDCDAPTAADAVTDGSRDFGIDAVGVAAGVPRLWLVQSKWSDKAEARFGEQDVMAIADGLRKIDHQEFDKFNEKLRRFRERIKAILSDRNCRITVVVVALRRDPLNPNVEARLNEVKAEFNVYGDYLDVEILTIRDVWEILRRTVTPKPIQLSVAVDRWFELATPIRAVNGVVLAGDAAAWHADHGDRLFAKNIRESLGVTSVNAEIARSLVDEPAVFWYRNNGIIMLCDRLTLRPNSLSAPHGPATVEVYNASIVNGAQTVAAIARAVNTDIKAATGLVGIRIIESSDDSIGTQITKATNTQNRIERRDFVALDPVQISIKEEFALSLNLTYSIRRSEFEPSPDSGCTVREAAMALACAHPNPEFAHHAKHNEELLWEEGPKGAYRQLFGVQPPAVQIWRSVTLLRAVLDALHRGNSGRMGRALAVAEQGQLVIAHLVFQQLGREGIDDADTDWSRVLKQVPEKVDEVLRRLVDEVDRSFGRNSLVSATFQSVDRVRKLVRNVLKGMASGSPAPPLAPDYQPTPQPRKGRRRNTVPVIVEAGRLKDGTPLVYVPTTDAERAAMQAWLEEDPRRGRATWVNSRSQPLVWAMDGEQYSPTGLVMKMWAQAEWVSAPVAAQGPLRWVVPGEGSLVDLANAILRESGAPDEEVAG
jgi:hypothetical protein